MKKDCVCLDCVEESMKTNEVRKKIFNLVLDWYKTCEPKCIAKNLMYGDPNYWVDEIMEILTEERTKLIEELKEDQFKHVDSLNSKGTHETYILGYVAGYNEAINKLEDLKKLYD